MENLINDFRVFTEKYSEYCCISMDNWSVDYDVYVKAVKFLDKLTTVKVATWYEDLGGFCRDYTKVLVSSVEEAEQLCKELGLEEAQILKFQEFPLAELLYPKKAE